MQVPIVIKEALDVYGYPSTFGWNYTSFLAGGVDLIPKQNAAVRVASCLVDTREAHMSCARVSFVHCKL